MGGRAGVMCRIHLVIHTYIALCVCIYIYVYVCVYVDVHVYGAPPPVPQASWFEGRGRGVVTTYSHTDTLRVRVRCRGSRACYGLLTIHRKLGLWLSTGLGPKNTSVDRMKNCHCVEACFPWDTRLAACCCCCESKAMKRRQVKVSQRLRPTQNPKAEPSKPTR